MILRIAALFCAVVIGFCIGRMVQPIPVRASRIGPIGESRVVHVHVKETGDAKIPPPEIAGFASGTPIALSCTENENGGGDCYVLMQLQGN